MNINLPEDTNMFLVVTDEIEIKRITKIPNMCMALDGIREHLRMQTKYNDNLTAEQFQAYEDMYGKFFEILEENHVSLDELWS
jgi:hypothetical protein